MGKRKKYKPGDVVAETRRVIKIGKSHYISLPPEFVEAHNIKGGDKLPIAANHIMKIIPMPEEAEEKKKPTVILDPVTKRFKQS